MSRNLSQLSHKNYDLLIVGGGINGAAIANMAAAAGARVVLLEKGDFASGTSSKSTKLLHGGIRYLENFEFDLVAESLKERFIQWNNAPHLVKPLSVVIPVYRRDSRPLWMMNLGVWLYDRLSGPYSLGIHRRLTKAEILQRAPGLNPDGLVGGVEYFDAQMNDARICLENVLMARKRGADTANYIEVTEFLKDNGHAVGVRAKDAHSGQEFEIRAHAIVVTTGPWADQLLYKDYSRTSSRLRPTKGVHIVYRGRVSPMADHAFLLQSPKDRRIFFMIPWKGNLLIGTTDTDYKGSPDKVTVEQQDIDYLLGQANRFFPTMNFDQRGIITTFAGLRPLVNERGSPSKVSRKHVIERTFSGVYYVMGGKFTTYRAIAQECVHKILPALARHLPAEEKYPLYGSGMSKRDVKSIAAQYDVAEDTVEHLRSLYGSQFTAVLDIILQEPFLKVKICTCSPTVQAQIVYSLRTEMARTPDDIFIRRLGLYDLDCPTRQCQKTIEEMCARHGSDQ